MYPYSIFANVNLYTVFLCLGILGAVIIYRIFADKKKIYWKVQNLVIISTATAIVGGYFSAVLFQALYNIESRGAFIIDSKTGATFYGGIVGGAAVFLLVYFVLGRFYTKNGEHVKRFFDVADIAAASITLAHGLGRLGCLMAGCCHGGRTDAWYGIHMLDPKTGQMVKFVPIQLYEAIFLFAMFAFFIFRLIKGKGYGLPLYMAIYGVWRFAIEYFRADHRGTTVVDFLSPSQFIAVLMVVGAIALYFGQRFYITRKKGENKSDEVVYAEE